MDSPDPDSLAAAVALRKLANNLGNLQCSIVCGGTVGRGENRALVKYLGLNLRCYAEVDYDKYDLIAMVDTQPGTGNNSLPEGFCRISSSIIIPSAGGPGLWNSRISAAATGRPPRSSSSI
jgi:nanoRNase/pAp phosphatase (c-di-AMP/oligoRNAs hydrolase)